MAVKANTVIATFVIVLMPTIMAERARAQCESGKFNHTQVETYTRFGASMALDGQRLIVGAPTVNWSIPDPPGGGPSVIIYRLEGGVLVTESTLSPIEGDVISRFGIDVDIDGDRAIAASLDRMHLLQYDPVSELWTESQQFSIVSDLQHYIPLSCAIDGDLAVVGHACDDTLDQVAGSAAVYRFDGQTFVEESQLDLPAGLESVFFGATVDISEGRIAVSGLIGLRDGRLDLAVLTYRQLNSQWTLESTLMIEESRGIWIGSWLNLNGNQLIAGNPSHNTEYEEAGAANVYRFDTPTMTWLLEAQLTAAVGSTFEFFGRSTAIEGDVALVGAVNSGDNLITLSRVHVFRRLNSSWVETDILFPAGRKLVSEFRFEFGMSVALTGNRVFIGDPSDYQLEFDAGVVYEFNLSGEDCNANGRCDPNDLADGTSTDTNANGIPDECEFAPSDINRDGFVNVFDLLAVLGAWGNCAPGSNCPADITGDGIVNVTDLLILLADWS